LSVGGAVLGRSIAHEAAHLAGWLLRGQMLGFLAFQSLNMNIFDNAFNDVFLMLVGSSHFTSHLSNGVFYNS
jgi:hypothetical protein